MRCFALGINATNGLPRNSISVSIEPEKSCWPFSIARRVEPRYKPIAARFRKHGIWYVTFIDDVNVQPTNNATERAIRHVVIDRKTTQGTRSAIGREWNQRIWSVLATSAQRARSPFECLLQAVNAHFNGTPAPRLLS